jgi:hypothetical protein
MPPHTQPQRRGVPELGDPPRRSDSCARQSLAVAIRAATVVGGTRLDRQPSMPTPELPSRCEQNKNRG